MPTEVSKNEDGTWHAPGAGDHSTKREAQAALEQHQQELQQAREARSHSDADVSTMTPDELMDYVDNAPIAARPARRADTSGEGRTLDALGNPT